MKVLMIMFLIFPITVFAQAEGKGNEGGNGGDVVICSTENRVSSPVLLDFFETHRRVNLGQSGDPMELARSVLKRVEKYDPVRSRLYEEGLKNFMAEAVFVSNFELPDIRDEGRVRPDSKHQLAVNCIKRQVVIQVWRPEYQENYHSWNRVRAHRYIIDKILWDKMDATNKAGLIIHELLVREGINLLGTSDTEMIRKINRFWSSSRMGRYSSLRYEYVMRSYGYDVISGL